MLCNSLHKFSRYESSVYEGQSSQQAQRVNETHQPRIVVDLQCGYQRGKSVRLAYVFAVRRVCHLLGPANGKCDSIIILYLCYYKCILVYWVSSQTWSI